MRQDHPNEDVFPITPQVGPELEALIQREFDGGATLQRALELVHLGGGIQAARRLARQEADLVGPPCLLLTCLPMRGLYAAVSEGAFSDSC